MSVRVSAEWLALREAADAAARAEKLVELVHRRVAAVPRAVIHDLGTGTGSMGRWLAPRLPGPQHWVLYDHDADLLRHAAAGMAGMAGMPGRVTVETRQRDITRLTAGDLAGATLVTASALLDMLTGDEVRRVVAACAGAGCPALLTISVIGRVELTPPDPLDAEIEAAFNTHQRRTVDGRRLLGPDQAGLAAEWFTGWVDAACEQRPELTDPVAGYARRRLADAAAGRLGVVVEHTDLLAGAE